MKNDKPHIRIPSSSITTSAVGKGRGGPKFERSDYEEHGARLLKEVKLLGEKIRSKSDKLLSKEIFAQVKTPKGVPIKDFKTKLNNLGMGIVAYSRKNISSATIKIKQEQFGVLEEKINEYATSLKHTGKSNISVIEQIEEVPLDEKIIVDREFVLSEQKEFDFVISLYTALSPIEKDAICNSLLEYFQTKGVNNAKKISLLSGQVFVLGKTTLAILKDAGEKYYTINSITPNGKLVATKCISANPLPSDLTISEPTSEIVVGVVDTGIDATTAIFSRLSKYNQNFLPALTTFNYSHGSMVASRVLFGDNIEEKVTTKFLVPVCYVSSICMLGENSTGDIVGHDEVSFSQIFGIVVKDNQDKIKIYNLSIGQVSITDGYLSVFAKELDFLSRQYNILFLISAGNMDTPPPAIYPGNFNLQEARIQSPAESLLSISIGSIANFSAHDNFARVKEISPFSCIGPGADGGIKPEMVSHGGNMTNTWGLNPRTATYGLDATATTLAYHVGTSFSAPIISNYAAQIYDLYSDATPNLAKALLIHFCKPVLHPALPGLNHQEFCGFGEPKIDEILDGTSSAMTFFHQGKIKKDIYQHIKFHVPSCLAEDNANTKLKIKITLVYNPPVNPDNPVEYSKCRMSLSVLKNSSSGLREFNMESNYNKPYSPILSFEKDFSRNYSTGEWQVRLRLSTKDDLPDSFEQDYAIIIQVIDSKGSGTVYEDVLKEFESIYQIFFLRKAA